MTIDMDTHAQKSPFLKSTVHADICDTVTRECVIDHNQLMNIPGTNSSARASCLQYSKVAQETAQYSKQNLLGFTTAKVLIICTFKIKCYG